MVVALPVVMDEDLAVLTKKFLEPLQKTDQKVKVQVVSYLHNVPLSVLVQICPPDADIISIIIPQRPFVKFRRTPEAAPIQDTG